MKDIKKIQEFFSKPLVKNTPRIDEGKKQDHDNDDITIDPDTEFNIDLRHLIQKHKITENGSKVSNSEILDVIDSIQGLIKNLKGDNSKKSPKLFSIAGPLIRELHKLVESNNKTNPSKLKVEGKIGEPTKNYGDKITLDKFSKLKGKKIKYSGSSYNVIDSNGYTIKISNGKTTSSINLNQFNKDGFISELVSKLKGKRI